MGRSIREKFGLDANQVIVPEAYDNHLREIWADKPLTDKFNTSKRQWSFPIWPTIEISFVCG